MSIELIENEIRRFLSSDEPEAICISGHWGVGKTFAWNRFLQDARAKDAIKLKHYSYVSLFGVNSLDELKYSIFENSVQSSDIGVEPSLETLKSNTTAVAQRFGKKSLWLLQQLPWVKSHLGGLGPVWFLSVRETIICVDDIERHGNNLPVRDILGLVSTLKEHKKCKVVLILNDEALEEDRDKKEFQTYLEKVVDAFLKFAPSPLEATNIALNKSTDANRFLAENCVAFGISNIRLIRKIERAVRMVEDTLKQFDQSVLRQAVQSLSLLAWSVYEPNRAPPLEYLKDRAAHLFGTKEREPATENEVAWNATLDAAGFISFDELDLVLLGGIQAGFFDQSAVEIHASALDKQAKAATSDKSFKNAWDLFHESFADSREQVIEAVYQTTISNIEYMAALNLNGTVWLLKELQRPDLAADVIDRYLAVRGKERKFFDLENHPFREKIDDRDLIQAFQDRYAALKDERDPVDVLLSIANKHGWGEEDISALATLGVDQYYDIFKGREGPDLRKIIDACLQFGTFGNASAAMKEISRRAKEALKRIGQESHINRLRVKKYGIEVDPVEADASNLEEGQSPVISS